MKKQTNKKKLRHYLHKNSVYDSIVPCLELTHLNVGIDSFVSSCPSSYSGFQLCLTTGKISYHLCLHIFCSDVMYAGKVKLIAAKERQVDTLQKMHVD